MPLGPRQENGVINLDGKLAVMGGYENILVEFAMTLEIFDPVAVQWEVGIPLNEELHHPNLAAVGDRAFILGFLRGRDWISDGRSFEYIPGTGWEPRAPMPAGNERGASGVAVVGDVVFVMGGAFNTAAGGTAVPTSSAYDPQSDAWADLPPMPTARHHLAAAAVGDVIYAVGGRTVGFDTPVPDVEAYDTASQTWSTLAPLPKPRGGLAVAAVGGCIYAIGGEGNADANDGMYNENEVYDPETNMWTAVAPMPLARHGTHAAVIDDWIYIPGGGQTQGQDAVSGVQVFVP